MQHPRALIILTCLCLVPSSVTGQPCIPDWHGLQEAGGLNSPVNALTVANIADKWCVYATGRFTDAAGRPVGRIARWDGRSWRALGTGITGAGSVGYAVTATSDGRILVGGSFTKAGTADVRNIAQWEASRWVPVGTGLGGPVYCLCQASVRGTESLYAGGDFIAAGETPVSHVARWNGSSWEPLGDGVNGRVVAAIEFEHEGQPALVVGGSFTQAGSSPASRIALWNGREWSPLGGGFNGAVFTVMLYDDNQPGGAALYAGGGFTTADGASAARIARWDGDSWSPVGGGVNGVVRAMAVFDEDDGFGRSLYIGGTFTNAGGQPRRGIARWNGSTWSPLGDGLPNGVFSLASLSKDARLGPAVFVGGSFLSDGRDHADYVARWDGCGLLLGDLNEDGVVSAADVDTFVACLAGPDEEPARNCHRGDMDGNGRIDLTDFADFSTAYTGE